MGDSLAALGQKSEGPGIKEWKAQGRPEPGVRVSRPGSPPYLQRARRKNHQIQQMRVIGAGEDKDQGPRARTRRPGPPSLIPPPLNLLTGDEEHLDEGVEGGVSGSLGITQRGC